MQVHLLSAYDLMLVPNRDFLLQICGKGRYLSGQVALKGAEVQPFALNPPDKRLHASLLLAADKGWISDLLQLGA